MIGFEVDFTRLDINMVFVKSVYDFNKIADFMKTNNIILGGYVGDYLRIVLHNDISKRDVNVFMNLLDDYVNEV